MKMNFYCDESCHIRNDGNDIMVIGTLYCDRQYIKKINKDINIIKEKYNFPKTFEIKWTKVSKLTFKMYQEIIKYIYDNSNIFIRTLVAKNKNSLQFESDQQYDIWYYKMFYRLINVPIENLFENTLFDDESINITKYTDYSLFLDKKNSKSELNAKKLVEVFDNTYHGYFNFNYIICNSKEFPLIQVIDLIIGAISYKCRNFSGSGSLEKVALIQYIEGLFSVNLNESTMRGSKKFNNFIWQGRSCGK